MFVFVSLPSNMFTKGSTRPFLKRPYNDSMRHGTGSKGGPAIKRQTQTKTKPGMKPGNGTTKQVSHQQVSGCSKSLANVPLNNFAIINNNSPVGSEKI